MRSKDLYLLLVPCLVITMYLYKNTYDLVKNYIDSRDYALHKEEEHANQDRAATIQAIIEGIKKTDADSATSLTQEDKITLFHEKSSSEGGDTELWVIKKRGTNFINIYSETTLSGITTRKSFNIPEDEDEFIAPSSIVTIDQINEFTESTSYFRNPFSYIITDKHHLVSSPINESIKTIKIYPNENFRFYDILIKGLIPAILATIITALIGIMICSRKLKANIKDVLNKNITQVESGDIPDLKKSISSNDEMLEVINRIDGFYLKFKELSERSQTKHSLKKLRELIAKTLAAGTSNHPQLIYVRTLVDIASTESVKKIVKKARDIVELSINQYLYDVNVNPIIIERRFGEFTLNFIIYADTDKETVDRELKDILDKNKIFKGLSLLEFQVNHVQYPIDGKSAIDLLNNLTKNVEDEWDASSNISILRKKMINEILASGSNDECTYEYSSFVSVSSGVIKVLYCTYSVHTHGFPPYTQKEIQFGDFSNDVMQKMDYDLISEALKAISIINDLGRGRIGVAISVSEYTLLDENAFKKAKDLIISKSHYAKELFVFIDENLDDNIDVEMTDRLSQLVAAGVRIIINGDMGIGKIAKSINVLDAAYISLKIKDIAATKHSGYESSFSANFLGAINDSGVDIIIDGIDSLADYKKAKSVGAGLATGVLLGKGMPLHKAIDQIELGFNLD